MGSRRYEEGGGHPEYGERVHEHLEQIEDRLSRVERRLKELEERMDGPSGEGRTRSPRGSEGGA